MLWNYYGGEKMLSVKKLTRKLLSVVVAEVNQVQVEMMTSRIK